MKAMNMMKNYNSPPMSLIQELKDVTSLAMIFPLDCKKKSIENISSDGKISRISLLESQLSYATVASVYLTVVPKLRNCRMLSVRDTTERLNLAR